MEHHYIRFQNKADQIELALRRINRWETKPLPPEAYENMGAFGGGTMSFVQWIQFILLVRIRDIIKNQDSFPASSSVAAFAVRELDGDRDADELITLLQELDDMIDHPYQGETAPPNEAPAMGYTSAPPPVGVGQSSDVPSVLFQLIDVLPKFEGDDLEAQLQTYDMFAGMADAAGKKKISEMLADAAEKMPTAASRLRVLEAAKAVAEGKKAAEEYNHDEAMRKYREEFKKSFPDKD